VDTNASPKPALRVRLMSLPATAAGWLRTWLGEALFGPGFAISHSICRVAVGYCLLTLFQGNCTQASWTAYLNGFNPDIYKPVGILYFLGDTPPPGWFFDACQAIASVTVWMVIAGLFTRISFVVCTLCIVLMTSVFWSFQPGWGHHQNVILLAAIGMMFGRSSPLSIDGFLAWYWARRRGISRLPMASQTGHRWPVLLGQFAVAMMFANACYWKLYQPGLPFGVWGWSDNMYHIIVHQFWVVDKPIPPYLDWALGQAWSVRLLGVGNLITQFSPCLAILLYRRPLLRALAGLGFVAEVLGLKYVMQLDLTLWLPLYALFVDWDALYLGIKSRFIAVETIPTSAAVRYTAKPWLRVGARFALYAWVMLFAGYYLHVAFKNQSQKRHTFPFSGFSMFSTIKPPAPYLEHKPSTLYASKWMIESDAPISDEGHFIIRVNYYPLPWTIAWADKTGTVEQIIKGREAAHKTKINRLTLYRTTYQIEALPARTVKECQSVISCIYDHGSFKGIDASAAYDKERKQHYIEVKTHGLANPTFHFGFYRNMVEHWQPLAVARIGQRYYFTREGKGSLSFGVAVRDSSLDDEELVFDGGWLW
jgi:hypothetical protein